MTINSTVNRGSWLVYFNGIEVPCISASVTAGVSQIPQASVTLPPDVTMRRIGAEDRVRLTIFYLDQYRGLVENESPKWRLMFDGEIVSYQYTNSPGGRSLSYTAVDLIEALGRIFAFFVTDLLSVAEGTLSTQQNSISLALNPLAPMASLFSKGLKDGVDISRPFDFVKNILDVLTDTGGPLANQRSVIASHWFSEWNNRTAFSKRFVPSWGIEDAAEPGTKPTAGIFPLLRAAQNEKAVEALRSLGNDVANNQSFYALIRTVFQHVYYELHANITPPYVTVNELTRDVVSTPRLELAQDVGLESRAAGDQENVIATYMTKPQTLFGIPPNCNVFWPSMVRQFSFSENFARQPTRTYVGNVHLFNVMTGTIPKGVGAGSITPQAVRAMTSAYPFTPADDMLEFKHANLALKTQNHHNFLVYPEEFFKGPVYYNHNMPPIFTYLARHQNDKAKELTRLYAKYEHFRTRFANRNGGVVMDFNPYVLHGFSCAYIDNEESNHHCFGYVTQITHSLSQDDMSTNVSFTYGQTFDEFFDNVVEDAAEFGTYGSAGNEGGVQLQTFTREQAIFSPRNPIEAIRDQFQIFPAAEAYYRVMLHRTEDWGINYPTAFNYIDILGVRNIDTDELSDIVIVPGDPDSSNVITDESTGRTPRFEVKGTFRRFLTDSNAAYAYVSRPVCTLEEWIEAQPDGVQETQVKASDPKQGKGADYWVKVLELIQGPGEEPTKDTEGNPCSALNVDTRRNWRDRILRFRQKVYLDPHHHRA